MFYAWVTTSQLWLNIQTEYYENYVSYSDIIYTDGLLTWLNAEFHSAQSSSPLERIFENIPSKLIAHYTNFMRMTSLRYIVTSLQLSYR